MIYHPAVYTDCKLCAHWESRALVVGYCAMLDSQTDSKFGCTLSAKPKKDLEAKE